MRAQLDVARVHSMDTRMELALGIYCIDIRALQQGQQVQGVRQGVRWELRRFTNLNRRLQWWLAGLGRIPMRTIMTVLAMTMLASSAMALDGTLVVANRQGGSISLFDLATEVEIARVPIGPVIPHEVDVSPDGRLVVTSEYGPNSRPGQRVVLIDIATATIVASIDLGPNSRPHSVVFLPDSRRAVATMQDSDQLALLDLEVQRVLRTYPTGAREGHMVRLSPDGKRAYVTSRGGEGTLSVIYLDEDRPPDVIVTGLGAEGIDVTPDGSEIWVANRSAESVSIVDAQSLEIIETLDALPFTGRIDIGGNGTAVMVNGRSGEKPVPQILRILDVESRTVTAEFPIRDGTPQSGNFGILVQDAAAIVADPGAGTIQIFALDGTQTRKVLASKHEGPDGLAWSPIRVRVMAGD